MPRQTLTSPHAPAAVGPYAQAVWNGDALYLSGQTPIDPATGKLIEGDIGVQTERAFENLKAVLEKAELGLDDVIKVNVYLTDMADFSAMNAAYERQFTEPFPARTTVAVAALPLGARVEIELVASR